MGRSVVLDLDLDFLVEGTGTLLEEPEKSVWCPANKLVKQLRKAGLFGGRVVSFIDQQASLAQWDRIGLQDAVAVHIDAHRDLYAFQNNAMRHPPGIRGANVGCGDYLFHALREGILAEVLQVVPDPMRLEDATRDVRRSCPEEIGRRVMLTRLDTLPAAVNSLNLLTPPVISTISISPAWLPPNAWPEAESVLTQFGLSNEQRQALYQKAQVRWANLQTRQAVSDYCFPYARRVSRHDRIG